MMCSATDTSWVVQPNGVLLVNDRLRTTLMVHYPEAAVWDLLTRNPVDAVVRKMGYIAGLDRAAAEDLVRSAIDRWLDLGFLAREAVHG